MTPTTSETKHTKWSTFLWDVFMCSLGSYGGPEAHYGVFSSIMVQKKKYLTEEELTEMIGLYALVPGPGSSQTITAASLILMTAITSIIKLPIDLVVYSVVVVATILLLIKKIPAPLIVLLAMLLGFLI
jgi:chromate transport protein ChrA